MSVTIVTPAWGLLLTTCVLVATPAKEEDPAARAQATLQQVSKLPQDHQRVWLRLIEQRYAWSILLTLKPDDAKREQARVAAILHQKTVGWNDLVNLLRQLDQREKAAIARLVRQYRTEVYETFHTRPRDMVDRQDAWYRIWSLWEKAGSPPEQQDRLMDWLAAAIKASTKEAIGPLPPDPKFGEGVELVPEQLVKQLSQPAAARPDATPQATARRPAADSSPGPTIQARTPLPLRVPDPSRVLGPAKQSSEAVAIRRVENRVGWSWLAEAPPAAVPHLHLFRPNLVEDPLELTKPPAPPHQALLAVVRRETLIAAESSTGVVAQAVPGGANPQTIASSRQPPQPPPMRVVEPPTPELPVAALAPAVAGPRATAPPESLAAVSEPPRKPASRDDAMSPLPRTLADDALPRPRRPVEYRVERKPPGPDQAAAQIPPPAPPAAQPDQHAQVNVEELGTRIEGINLSLRNLEAELREKREFTADQLDSLLSRLDILVLRQKDLTLFRELITPREQAKVGQVDSSRSIIASMGTRIAEMRIRIRDNEKLPETERNAVLKHLDELSDRLATMTAER